MQGKPVPAALPGLQELAAPLTIEPGLPFYGNIFPIDSQAALGLQKGLAVVVRAAATGVFLRKP